MYHKGERQDSSLSVVIIVWKLAAENSNLTAILSLILNSALAPILLFDMFIENPREEEHPILTAEVAAVNNPQLLKSWQ